MNNECGGDETLPLPLPLPLDSLVEADLLLPLLPLLLPLLASRRPSFRKSASATSALRSGFVSSSCRTESAVGVTCRPSDPAADPSEAASSSTTLNISLSPDCVNK